MTTQSAAIQAAMQFNAAVVKIFDRRVHGQPGLDFTRGAKRREREPLEAAKVSNRWDAPLIQAGIYAQWAMSAGRVDKVLKLIPDAAATEPAIAVYAKSGAPKFAALCQQKLDQA